jgi:hypothetical protein
VDLRARAGIVGAPSGHDVSGLMQADRGGDEWTRVDRPGGVGVNRTTKTRGPGQNPDRVTSLRAMTLVSIMLGVPARPM